MTNTARKQVWHMSLLLNPATDFTQQSVSVLYLPHILELIQRHRQIVPGTDFLKPA